MRKKHQPGCPCCECEHYCEIMFDSFTSNPIDPTWAQVGAGSWENLGGVARTDDSQALMFWQDAACSNAMVVICEVGAVVSGNTVYVVTNYNPTTGTYAFCKITQDGVLFDLAIGEFDGEDEIILDSIADQPFTGYVKLCSNQGRIKAAFSPTAAPVLSAFLGINPGKYAGLGTGEITGFVSFEDFGIYKYDEETCRHCLNQTCECELCSNPAETPCQITATVDGLPEVKGGFDPNRWGIADGNHVLRHELRGDFDENTTDGCVWDRSGASANYTGAFIEDHGDGSYTLWAVFVSWEFSVVFKKTYGSKPDCHSWDEEELTYSAADSNPPPNYNNTPTCFITSG